MSDFIPVARVEDIQPGQKRRFVVNGLAITLINLNGRFFATQDACTHESASLTGGEIVDGCLECPRHGARFDIATGAVRSLPATQPLRVFPVKVEGTSLLVSLNSHQAI